MQILTLARLAGRALSLLAFLLARANEPGTLRSLAVVFFALKGIVPSDAVLQGTVDIGILLLGGASALMPEPSTKAAIAAAQAAVPAELREGVAAAVAAAPTGLAGRVAGAAAGLMARRA